MTIFPRISPYLDLVRPSRDLLPFIPESSNCPISIMRLAEAAKDVASVVLLPPQSSPCSLHEDGKVFLYSADGQVHALELGSGRLLWTLKAGEPLVTAHLGQKTQRDNAEFSVVPSLDGSLFLVHEGQPLRKFPANIKSLALSSPALSEDGITYIGKKEVQVILINKRTGVVGRILSSATSVLGAKQPEMYQECSASKCNDDMENFWFLTRTDFVVQAFDTVTGIQRWNASFGELSAIDGSLPENIPVASFLQTGWLPIIGASASGGIRAYNPCTGTQLWDFNLHSPLSTAFSVISSINSEDNLARLRHIYFRVLPEKINVGELETRQEDSNDEMTAAISFETQPRMPSSFIWSRYANGRPLILSNSFHDSALALDDDSFLTMKEKQAIENLLPSFPDTCSSGFCLQDSSPYVINPTIDDSNNVLPNPSQSELSQKPGISITFTFPENFDQSINYFVLFGAVVLFLYLLVSRITKFIWSSQKKVLGLEMKNGRLQVGKVTVDTSSCLGSGSHGTLVYEGFFEGRPVAVKRLLGEFYENANKEINLLMDSDHHPNVLRYFARENDGNFIYVALERCMCTLADLIVGTKQLFRITDSKNRPTKETLNLLLDIFEGIKHLHYLNIVHRDIKPQNILITHDGRVKIADMGLGKKLENSRNSFDTANFGSAGWHAPETLILRQNFEPSPRFDHSLVGENSRPRSPAVVPRLTRSVDNFSLGCVVFYVLSHGRHPYGESFERDANILRGKADLSPVKHLPEAYDLVKFLIDVDPSKRLTCEDAMAHPFFWTEEQKLDFICHVSDRVETEKPESELRTSLETFAPLIVGNSWNELIYEGLLANLGKYRKYNYSSIRDCLRVIRNKKNHYRDLPEDVQNELGSLPVNFYYYFADRFPNLVVFSFYFIAAYASDEAIFSKIYSRMSENTILRMRNTIFSKSIKFRKP